MLPSVPWSDDLASRIWLTMGVLLVYRLGIHVPLPGIDTDAFVHLLPTTPQPGLGQPFSSSGAAGRLPVFALGVMPYISSCIFLHAIAAFYSPLRALRREGVTGWRRFNQYVRMGAVVLAAWQAYGIAVAMENVTSLVPQPGLQFRISVTVTLVAGSMLLIWLGERIFARGATDGIWLLFVASQIADLPAGLAALAEISRTGAVAAWVVPAGGAVLVALVALIVLVERAERQFPTPGATRGVSTESFRLDNTGVLAPAIATTVYLLPLLVTLSAGPAGQMPGWAVRLAEALMPGQALYLLIYALAIVLLVFFFTRMLAKPYTGRPEQVAERDAVLMRLTLIGGLYLAVLCTVSELLIRLALFPFYVGGISLLVVVLVALDVLSHLQRR
jgi:preprotein translocase subunit SecY